MEVHGRPSNFTTPIRETAATSTTAKQKPQLNTADSFNTASIKHDDSFTLVGEKEAITGEEDEYEDRNDG